MIISIVSIILTAMLWGITNPLIKKGSTNIKQIQAQSFLERFFLEIKYLVTNWNYILPMILNQSGSLLYFLTLQRTELSLIVPVTNSLTFLFTALSGWILGEKFPNKRSIYGMFFITLGTLICFLDKCNYT